MWHHLRKPSLGFSETPCRTAAFALDALSLPARAGGCLLADALPFEDRVDLLEFESRLLLSTEELERRRVVEGRARAYWDSTLEDDPVTYRSFIRSLNERNMLRFEFASQEEVGIFCVEKKNGKLRLIVDCRRLNQRMRCPPRARLASTGAMAEFQSDFIDVFLQCT